MSPTVLLIATLSAAPQGELLDFTASWCGPCQQMTPIVERLRREGYPIRQVDVDRHRDLAQHYKISGIPAFVLIVNGQEVAREVGVRDEAALRRMLAKIPMSEGNVEPPPERKRSWIPWNRPKNEPAAEPPLFDEPESLIRSQSPEPPARTAPPSRGASSAAPPAARDPMESAVRIRVKDASGVDYGSGTLIGSQEGKALVLTCWHIFRDFGESATVEVDVFPSGPNGPVQTYPGKLLRHDQKADVALIGMTGCGILPVSPIAGRDAFPKQGDHVFSIGCGEGKEPTKQQHTVTQLNRYLGPDTIECTGMPVVGRSGGGLFDPQGRLVGVCFAAEREDRRGVYAGTAEVHKLLESAGYAALIPAPGSDPVALAEAVAPSKPADQNEMLPVHESPSPFAEFEVADAEPAAPARSANPARRNEATTSQALAALDDDVQMEATIILRPLNRPGAPSEVIVINKVSKKTLRYLRGDTEPRPVETSLRVPVERLDRGCLVTADRCEPERPAPYIRSAESRRAPRGIALLHQVFDNHRGL